MLADGHLSDQEIIFLKTWLEENDEIAYSWPGEVIYRRISRVLEDNIIDDDERTYLTKTLEDLIGGSFEETGATSGVATSLPVQDVETMKFKGKKFCFSGQFLFGTRAACHKETERVGAKFVMNVSKGLDYLVIGTMSTRSWANTSFGRKIERAMEYQKEGCDLLIIDEECWARHLPAD